MQCAVSVALCVCLVEHLDMLNIHAILISFISGAVSYVMRSVQSKDIR